MVNGFAYSGAGMHVVGESLIASLNGEPDDNELRRLQKDILSKMETLSIRGVLVDVSRVRVLDSILFAILSETAKLVALLGGETIFVGFQAGVASALVDLDVDLGSINTAVTMEDGLEQLHLSFKSPGIEEVVDEERKDDESRPDDLME